MTPAAMLENFDSPDDRIDELCDDFEAAWRNGTRPRMLEFVARGPDELRSKLFYELLLVELELRRDAGEQPHHAEYLENFSDFGPEIESVAFSYGESAFVSPTSGREETEPREEHEKRRRIGHYQLFEKIGEGAMGEVWKAWDTRLKRPVAIKLPRSQTLSEAELRRFLREGQAVGQLKHPQLAAVHDIGRWGDSAYIVVDYVEGENLRKRLARGKLGQREMVEICADVAEALHHAHERGVVHRDLKPANIIVDQHGRSHVIDFGLAKWATDDRDLTLHGELLGTPAYMSPEQARGEGANAGPATDIYSLGVILYEMLTGACPFTGGHGSVLHQIANTAPLPPRQKIQNVPRDLETICLKALEKDPLRRFKTIQEMAVDLRRFERGEPIVSRPPGAAEKAWRWARRHTPLLAAGLIAVFAVGVTLLASSLALQNRALQGLREVGLTTDPPGARIAFARLSNIGELLPDQVTQCGPAPGHVELYPGDYFVEAVWPDGRFHQVLRRVPSGSQVSNGGRHQVRSQAGPGLSIILPPIKCPSADVNTGMVEESIKDDSFPSTFHFDPHYMTVGELRHFNNQVAEDRRLPVSPDAAESDPVRATFDEAAALAETLGKRLPTNLEYQRLLDLESIAGETESPAGHTKPASDIKHVSKSEFMRYTAPYNSLGGVRLVRDSHPRFISEK